MSKAIESILKGPEIVIKNTILLVPYAVPIIVQLFFGVLAGLLPERYIVETYIVVAPNPYISFLGYLIASILGFIAACMLVDMANNIIKNRPVDLKGSLNLVISRISTLIIVAIIAALCAITILLLPVAIFIVVVVMIEGAGAIEGAMKTFNFVVKNLGEVLIYIIIVIIVGAIFTFGFSMIPVVGPYISTIITWLINAMFTVSAVHLYLSLTSSTSA